MQQQAATTGDGYPIQVCMIANGRYFEGLCNCPADHARFLSLAGGHMPAAFGVMHAPSDRLPIRRH